MADSIAAHIFSTWQLQGEKTSGYARVSRAPTPGDDSTPEACVPSFYLRGSVANKFGVCGSLARSSADFNTEAIELTKFSGSIGLGT